MGYTHSWFRSQLVPPVLTKNTDLLKQEVHEHITADAVIQGSYWEDGRGCFIGCLTHCDDPAPAVERFGLTTPILRIAERIFESLPPEEAKAFFYEFPSAVGCDNKDLSLVHWQFLAETLRNLPPQHPENQAVINTVITGIDSLASGGSWDATVATEATRAATVAATRATTVAASWATEAAAAAARATIWSARATRASARAAEAAAWARATEATAWDAGDATASARAAAVARAAETRRQRDSLLRLIREAPVATPSLV